MFKKLLTSGIILCLTILTYLPGADFQNNLQQMAENNAKEYVQPLVTGMGTSFNSGLYKKAKVKPGGIVIPVGFDIGIVTSAAVVPDEDKTFNFQIPDGSKSLELNGESINLDYTYIYESQESPTIAGDGKTNFKRSDSEIAESIENETDLTNVTASDVEGKIPALTLEGLNASTISNIALQTNVRFPIIGLEITGRGFPEYQAGDIGKISSLGFGLRKSIPIPFLDLTAGAMYQNLNVGDFFDLKNMNYHLEVGKSISIPFLLEFSPYAGLGVDQTTASIDYTLERTGQKIKFDLDGENQFRINAGVTAQIIPFTYLNLEVSKGKYLAGTVSTGIILK